MERLLGIHREGGHRGGRLLGVLTGVMPTVESLLDVHTGGCAYSAKTAGCAYYECAYGRGAVERATSVYGMSVHIVGSNQRGCKT